MNTQNQIKNRVIQGLNAFFGPTNIREIFDDLFVIFGKFDLIAYKRKVINNLYVVEGYVEVNAREKYFRLQIKVNDNNTVHVVATLGKVSNWAKYEVNINNKEVRVEFLNEDSEVISSFLFLDVTVENGDKQ